MTPVTAQLTIRLNDKTAEWVINTTKPGKNDPKEGWYTYSSLGTFIRQIAEKIGHQGKKKIRVQLSNAAFAGAKVKFRHRSYEFFGDPDMACTYQAVWLDLEAQPDPSKLYSEIWICDAFLKSNGFATDADLWLTYSLEDRDEAGNSEVEGQKETALRA